MNTCKAISLSLLLLSFLITGGCTADRVWEIGAIQTVSNDPVKELDALQTANGSLIMATMERPGSGLLEHNCVVYRSTDAGENWKQTLILEDTSQYTRQYADPRLVEDTLHNQLYLVVMQVKLPARRSSSRYRRDYYLGDIAVYRSDDDGQTWQYKSHPHIDPEGAYGDLPFPLIDQDGCLQIFYSRLDTRKLIDPSDLVIRRSCDGGISWSKDYLLGDSLIANTRKNLGNLLVKDPATIAGVFADQQQFYYFELNRGAGFGLSRIERIPHTFGGNNPPLVYLSYDRGSEYLNIISYLPHQRDSPIWYTYSEDDGHHWNSQKIGFRGAYPNVSFLEKEGILITFNHKAGKKYQLLHTYTSDRTGKFPSPTMLYENKFRFTEAGEYQALFRGSDGNIHLFFCDWSDYSRGKYTSLIAVDE
ncbi:MAG: sialidase family protein [Saprospiraceae bacterium]|nr:exo-alpha-sialidase [Lewinella sp.]